MRALALVPDTEISLRPGEERFLLAVQPVPHAAGGQRAGGADAPTASTSSARWRADGLRRMYIGTLTLALVLAVFGAVLLAVLLGNQLVRPLILLADGVRQVAAGDLSSQAGVRLARRARRADALLRRHDGAAGRRARGRCSAA